MKIPIAFVAAVCVLAASGCSSDSGSGKVTPTGKIAPPSASMSLEQQKAALARIPMQAAPQTSRTN